MKLLLCGIFLVALSVNASSQISLSNSGDSLYPVTNYNNETISFSSFYDRIIVPSTVYNIAKGQGKYFLMGNFTNISANQGSALIVDTATQAVVNAGRWRINGTVLASVPDGNGGFYIAGTFTKIGDSSRKYLAQINSTGQPTSFRPLLDSVVKCLFIRNDTLFIGGAFKTFNNKPRSCFAMYQISGDSLCRNGGIEAFNFMRVINSFVVQNDTLIYGGIAANLNANIRKYNFRTHFNIGFTVGATELGEINHLALSDDRSTLIYEAYYNGEYVKAVNNSTGTVKYYINVSRYWPNGSNSGFIYSMKLLDNKVYCAGYFNHLLPSGGGIYNRKGFFVFDALTGAVLPEDLNANWYPNFLNVIDGKIYLSGKFTQINSVPREHFAVVDTGSLALNPLQIDPTDNLTSLAFSGNKLFVAGEFRGLYAAKRNGLAAFDSATHALLPWNPVNTTIKRGKKMFVRGDSLFVFGGIFESENCTPQVYTALKIYSISTGNEYTVPFPLSGLRIDELVADGNFLYVSAERKLLRFSLPSLAESAGWGMNWNMASGYEHNVFNIITDGNRLFGIGDTRFTCSNFIPYRAYLVEYNKNTGVFMNRYYYESDLPLYEQPMFSKGLISGNKIFVHGAFTALNGNDRNNFVALNKNTGAIENWTVPIPFANHMGGFQNISPVKLYNGKIWVGGSEHDTLLNGTKYKGFGAIDSLSGNISMPISMKRTPDWCCSYSVRDFIINDDELVLVGTFDSVNGKPFNNFIHLKVSATPPAVGITACAGSNVTITSNVTGTSYQWQVNTGSGFTDLAANATYSGVTTSTLTISNVSTSLTGYLYRNIADGNTSNNFELTVNTTPGAPIISASGNSTFCAGGSLLITSNAGSGFQWFKDGIAIAGATGQNYTATQSGSYSVRSNISGCISPFSNAVNVTVNPVPAAPVITAAGPVTVCAGTAVTLTSSLTTGNTWLLSGNTVAGATGQNYSPAVSGVYSATNTVNGCTSNPSNAITVTFNPAVVPSVSISYSGCPSGNLAFSSTTTNGGSAPVIQWYVNSVLSGTGATFNLNNATNGMQVYARLNSNMNCATPSTANSTTSTINCITTALPKIDGLEMFRVSPNPSPGLFIVNYKLNRSFKMSFEVNDAEGKNVFNAHMLAANGTGRKVIDLSILPQGVYYLVTIINRKTITTKLVIQR